MPKPCFIYKNNKIAEIVRVNYAGEFGAQMIYKGQIDFTNNKKDKMLFEHMLNQELEHLDYFYQQMISKNIRPSLLMPVWLVGGYLLGMISAKLGMKSAMVVTEAIEDVIESHYQEQIDYLELSADDNDMLYFIKKFQKDESEHKQIAIDHDSQYAVFSKLFFKKIRLLCVIAINISKKL